MESPRPIAPQSSVIPTRPPAHRLAFLLAAAVLVVLLAVGAVVWVLMQHASPSKSQQATAASNLKDELRDAKLTVASVEKRVTSSLGFSVQYNPDALSARAQTTDPKSADGKVFGESFEGDEVAVERPYSIVKLEPRGATSLATPELAINTNIRAAFWDRFEDKQPTDARKLKLLTSYLTKNYSDSQSSVTESTSITINNSKYQRVVLSRDNTVYGINKASEMHMYITVQNGRPYWITIYNATVDPVLTSQFEQTIASVSYQKPDSSLLGTSAASATLASVELPENTSNLPDDIESDTVIPVVLRNQPAVVRILSVRCGSVVLSKGANKVVLPKSCNGGVGSGSFISADGYIGTNGHVVTVTEANLLAQSLQSVDVVAKVLDFLVKTGTMSDAKRTAFLEALRSGDSAAQAALAQLPQSIPDGVLSVSDDSTHYAVQVSNQPMRIHDWQISFDDTILEAELVAMNYDADNAEKALRGEGSFTSSDVAILKIKAGGAFPTVTLAADASLQSGDHVTAIGYPAFVDNALSTDQWQTVPTVTQGTINTIYDDALYGGRVAGTSVQIAPGNSGGPAFNDAGEQGGLMTYGAMRCSDQRCFGAGSFRDVADLRALATEHNVTLKSGSITSEWQAGLGAYAKGDYRGALQHFDTVKREYPANYLAPELSRMARSQIGSASDTSNTTAWVVGALIVLIAVGIAAIVVVVSLLVRTARAKHIGPPPLTGSL